MILSQKYLQVLTCFNLLIGFVATSGCRHYHLAEPGDTQFLTIAIGSVENKTNEPRLAVYTKEKLSELIMLMGSMTMSSRDDAEVVLHTEVLSYKVGGIGEIQIESENKDLRKFRSSVFRVKVTVEYSVTNPANHELLVLPRVVHGIAEFNELVDSDVVRKDGFRRAIYDACDQIVSSFVDIP